MSPAADPESLTPAAPLPEFVVKVCGMTSVCDAELAARAGAHAVGFNFYSESPRFVRLEVAREMSAALPSAVLRVGVFVNADATTIRRIAASVPLDVVQLHGALTPARLPTVLRVWRALPVDSAFSTAVLEAASAAANHVEAFLLDAPSKRFGGSGQTFDWARVSGIRRPVVLAGGLDAANVARAIAAVRPWGVDACSRLESKPGRKDANKVLEFVAAALEAARAMQQEMTL